MSITTSARHATLSDLSTLLNTQQDLKLDAVVPASDIVSHDGNIVIKGLSVFEESTTFRPTEIADAHIASKLDIPLGYIRTLREQRPDLYDANVNGWLGGYDWSPAWNNYQPVPADSRSFLIRTFSNPDGGEGILRSLQSDRFAIFDNIDVLMAGMQGINDSGVSVEFAGADLSERRMTVRFFSPAVQALAPTLLAGYRSPFSGASGADNPTVFAGFELSNSETGGGAFTVTPRLVVEVCSNGLKMTKDVFRKVHLGSKLDEGLVQYGDDTRRMQIDLVKNEARDVVKTFLNPEYLAERIGHLESKAGAPVEDAVKTIELVSKQQHFSADEQALILSHFIDGGQRTAGGVMQAITSAAQQIDDPDRAYELESSAVAAMEFVAA
jgi:hypothetical protein